MPRHHVQTSTICPFYRGEEKTTIYCEGVEPGVQTILAFGRDARDYKRAFCRKDWDECRIAKMLAEKYE